MSGSDHGTPIEVQGFFPSFAALTAAVERLEDAGFRRGDLSPPQEHPYWGKQSEADSKNGFIEDENSAQLRTLGTGMAGYAGAAAAAGLTIATGGTAALAVGAAVVAGLGSAALSTTVGKAGDDWVEKQYDDLASQGRLVLGVRTAIAEDVITATRLLTEAGAKKVEPIYAAADATTAGISSASWTG